MSAIGRPVYLFLMAIAFLWVAWRIEVFAVHAGDTREGWYSGVAAACALIAAFQYIDRFVQTVRKRAP